MTQEHDDRAFEEAYRPGETARPGDVLVPVPETDASDVDDVDRCPYCDRPFKTGRQRALHVGEAHADRATPGERAVHERALADERDELYFFHMKVVVALGILYSSFVISYTAVVNVLG